MFVSGYLGWFECKGPECKVPLHARMLCHGRWRYLTMPCCQLMHSQGPCVLMQH
jgi:hypothetical protein